MHLVQRSHSIKDCIFRNVCSYSSAPQFTDSLAHNCASEVNGQKHRNFIDHLSGCYPLRGSLVSSINSVLRAYYVLVLHSCSRGIFIFWDLFMSSSGEVLKGSFCKMNSNINRNIKPQSWKMAGWWGRVLAFTLWWIALNKQNYLGLPDCQVLIPTIIRLEALRATVTSSRGGAAWAAHVINKVSLFCGHKQLTVFK